MTKPLTYYKPSGEWGIEGGGSPQKGGLNSGKKTYFEKITASPEVLAEFLACLPVLDAPWDKVFQETFCGTCEAENCDAENCPHNEERNSPAWFLAQEVADDGKDPLR